MVRHAIVNLPTESVVVAAIDFFAFTATPDIGRSLSTVTVPVTIFMSCALAENMLNTNRISINDLIFFIFLLIFMYNYRLICVL